MRESTNYPGDYTLCVSCDGKVEHYRIIYHNGKLTIDEEEYFENLMQLVEVRASSTETLWCRHIESSRVHVAWGTTKARPLQSCQSF